MKITPGIIKFTSIALFLGATSFVYAASLAITIDPGDEGTTYFNIAPQTPPGGPLSIGLVIQVTTSIEVSGLGIWDPAGNVASSPVPHSITIFDSSGSAVVTTQIHSALPATELTAQDNFLFRNISPTLLPSDVYTISAHFPAEPPPGEARIADFFGGVPSSSADITLLGSLEAFGLTGPTDSGSSSSYYSPNILFDVVPEPSSALLIAVGFLGLMARRK